MPIKTVRVVLGLGLLTSVVLAAWAAFGRESGDSAATESGLDSHGIPDTGSTGSRMPGPSADPALAPSTQGAEWGATREWDTAVDDEAFDERADEASVDDEALEPLETESGERHTLTPEERASRRQRLDRQLSLVSTLSSRVELAIQEAERDGDADRAQDLRATRERLEQRREFVQTAIEENDDASR